MAENKNNNSEDMSVDELVNLLRNNISADDDVSEDTSEIKTITRKTDPDKDIASMLKNFIGEDGSQSDDFELDDAIDEIDDNFELDTENDSSEAEFEFDESADEAFGAEFDEPEDNTEIFDDFEPDESSIIDAVAFENAENSETPKKKGLGGLFGLGRKNQSGLADGYAKMLEMELDSEENDNASDEDEAFLSVSELDNDLELEDTYSDAEDGVDPDYVKIIDEMDMPELVDFEAEENASELENVDFADDTRIEPVVDSNYSSADSTENGSSDPMVSPIFVFGDTEDQSVEPEEDYFVNEKKPLAFDDEDETPIVPDESAFENVPSSDAIPEDISSEERQIIDGVSDGELDDKDINIMIALGYEEELEKAIGKKNVDEISDQINAEIVDFIDVDKSYAFDGFELNSPDGFRSVGSKYKQENSEMKLRLLGTGVFALALFIFEFLGIFGVTLGGALNIHHYPVVGIMLSLQLLLLSASLSWRQMLDGLKDAITFDPSPCSIPAVAVLMTVIYNLVMALIAPNTGLNLYNFPAALCLVFMVLNDYFDLSREIRSFNTIATRRPKYAAIHSNPAARSAEEEMAEIFSSENYDIVDSKILETKKVGFIDNYFHRTNIRSLKSRKLNFVIFPFIALAIALGILSFVTNKSALTAFNISILTIQFGMPMGLLFIYSYPLFSAVKTAFSHDATIIGEASVEEYSNATTVVFAEKEIFPLETTVTKGIKLYDNNAIYYVLYHLTSLYSKIGGPLKDRLVQATAEMGYSEDVEILSVDEKGVEAVVDGKVRVVAGQAQYMEGKGIFTGNDPDDEKMFAEGASALYLVLDGVLSAKLYVNYAVDPELEDVIAFLGSENMEAVIRSSDPNIDNELLASKLRVSRFPARIVKNMPEANEDISNADSGIVSRSSLTALAHSITLCNKIKRVRKTSKAVSIVSMVISVIMMIFLALFSSKITVPSIYVALYQVFWMIPLLLFTKLNIK